MADFRCSKNGLNKKMYGRFGDRVIEGLGDLGSGGIQDIWGLVIWDLGDFYLDI